MSQFETEPRGAKRRKQSSDGGRTVACPHRFHRFLDVHRRGRQPELNLDATSPFEPRPPQAMQLLPQAECSLHVGLSFDQTLLAQRASQPFLSGLTPAWVGVD